MNDLQFMRELIEVFGYSLVFVALPIQILYGIFLKIKRIKKGN